MNDEYEVEIDGTVFRVRQISALEHILAERDSEKLAKELKCENTDLIARAYLLASSLYMEDKPAFNDGYEVMTSFTADKIYELTQHVVFRERVTERITEKNTEYVSEPAKETTMKDNTTQIDGKYESNSYRSSVEKLSRYLHRDSRRYDGYFEMY